ncbi:acetyl-CoA carboxylase biotin carboxyl carrier protein subunit [Hippea maritima]|uniref:Biotin/lipoyl attachment domain-containing protein n=1 Tax=Hippea maritima (strain ATCC 700847 / DSM 10411 / MH2) TaxID=760142 RepID=F2LVK7_HIPMA|nr:acetyl-CoA carboxylase biotin carboxyl carrier protein subunit [Hippea maritima]AEA33791.1 biotin/lipoyl attachment domain-containing protein [Hippea maritima DSM 10411]
MYIATLDNVEYKIDVKEIEPNKFEVIIDEKSYIVDAQLTESSVYSLIINGKSYEVNLDYKDGLYYVYNEGDLFKIEVMDELKKRMLEKRGGAGGLEGAYTLKSEMPGKIIDVKVNEGDEVKEGDIVLILEAMKMQNEIRSPKDGKVTEVFVEAGEVIEAEAKLVTIE